MATYLTECCSLCGSFLIQKDNSESFCPKCIKQALYNKYNIDKDKFILTLKT